MYAAVDIAAYIVYFAANIVDIAADILDIAADILDIAADILDIAADILDIVADTLYLPVNTPHFIIDVVRHLQQLRRCHPRLFLRQFVEPHQAILDVRVSRQLLENFF